MKEILVKPAVSIAADVHCGLERMITPAEALISSGLIDSSDVSFFTEGKFETCMGDTEFNTKKFYALQQRGRFVRGCQ